MKKKFTAFAVCLMMIAALACPADAAAAPRDSGVSPMAEGNGYTSDSFQYGGQLLRVVYNSRIQHRQRSPNKGLVKFI